MYQRLPFFKRSENIHLYMTPHSVLSVWCVWVRDTQCVPSSKPHQKECHTHKKKKIFGLTAAELEGKKHTTTRGGGGAFLKTRLFAESLLMFLNVYLVVVSFYGFTNDLTQNFKPSHGRILPNQGKIFEKKQM